MRERFSAWAFPVKWPGDNKRSRWKRFETEHDILAMLIALVCVAAFVAALLGFFYVLEAIGLLHAFILLWAILLLVGVALGVPTVMVRAFRERPPGDE